MCAVGLDRTGLDWLDAVGARWRPVVLAGAGGGREGTRMTEDRGPDPKPPEDDIRWLIYLAIGLVAFLALVAWSGFHNVMGH